MSANEIVFGGLFGASISILGYIGKVVYEQFCETREAVLSLVQNLKEMDERSRINRDNIEKNRIYIDEKYHDIDKRVAIIEAQR